MREHNGQVKRGEIYYIHRANRDVIGSEQDAGRPAVIVSNDTANSNSPVVEVVYCTTRPKEELPTHVTIESTHKTSTVLCEQVSAVSVNRIGSYIGKCTKEEMGRIDQSVMVSLGLKKAKEDTPTKEEADALLSDYLQTVYERDTYKRLYEIAVDDMAAMVLSQKKEGA